MTDEAKLVEQLRNAIDSRLAEALVHANPTTIRQWLASNGKLTQAIRNALVPLASESEPSLHQVFPTRVDYGRSLEQSVESLSWDVPRAVLRSDFKVDGDYYQCALEAGVQMSVDLGLFVYNGKSKNDAVIADTITSVRLRPANHVEMLAFPK